MIWWYEQIIIYEESIQEMDDEKHHHINEDSESFVAREALEFPDALLARLAKEVVVDQSDFLEQPETNGNCWDV